MTIINKAHNSEKKQHSRFLTPSSPTKLNFQKTMKNQMIKPMAGDYMAGQMKNPVLLKTES